MGQLGGIRQPSLLSGVSPEIDVGTHRYIEDTSRKPGEPHRFLQYRKELGANFLRAQTSLTTQACQFTVLAVVAEDDV